jgi:uncharacterized phage protein (TIGR01671 family)
MEIKFRGKRTDNGVWVYGYCVVRAGMPFIFSFGVIEPILVIPETVGQYVGLEDKNGREIYEGDIIHFPSTKMGQCESTKVVIWDDEDKYIALCNLNEYRNKEFFDKDNIQEMIVFYIEDLVNAEIIGNKFDTPELLEVEE